ncbi:unnamed protein product [marine sediment metagenome]|uniref:Tail tube protein n=1 Tax=marine sediment metagenome TaxID=412755 RepID=X0UYZ8_9ZZZZ
MAEPLINGRAYDYVDIQVSILGAELNGVTEVNYTSTQEKVNNFGTGVFPTSRGRAARDTAGSIGLSMNEVEALREIAPLGNLLDIPAFDIVVVFGNVQAPQTHIVKNCEFLSDGTETSQGDTSVNRVYDFVASHVQYR